MESYVASLRLYSTAGVLLTSNWPWTSKHGMACIKESFRLQVSAAGAEGPQGSKRKREGVLCSVFSTSVVISIVVMISKFHYRPYFYSDCYYCH